jgi:hypothetical protein
MKKTENLITAIAVRGYKSICSELRMELKPLTVLAGANSSGKSSFMQPVLLLKQTLENPFDPGVFRLNGPNVRFTSAEQLLSKVQGQDDADSFLLRFERGNQAKVGLSYRKVEGKGLDIDYMDFADGEHSGRVTLDMTHEDILKVLPEPLKKLHEDFPAPVPKREWQWIVYRERCFLAFALARKGAPTERMVFGGMQLSPSSRLIPEIEAIIHVPGLRGNPERNYTKTTSVGPNFPGTFENYVASVVSQWQTSDAANLEKLGNALEDLGLTWKVDARSLDDTQVELRVGRLLHGRRGGAYDMVNIADVGFGVSQILPVIVALLVARPGQIVYVEQPEIHLHPYAQRRLVGILATAAKRGIRVVIETHSALLLREIQTMVARGKLASNLVKLHWFKRNRDDGVTEITSADLDENGAFGEDWPEDFDEMHLAAEKAYLDAVEERAAQP